MIHKITLILVLLLSSPKGIDADKVRYGNLTTFKEGQTVHVIDSKKIYSEIPYYQTIIRKKLKKGTAEYTHLMLKATELYKGTLGKSGLSLIVEFDGVDKTLHKTEDVTKKIISLL